MKARKEMVRLGTKVGAALGAISFLIFGLIPGFYFGSYGAMVVMKHLLGAPLEPSVLVRMIVAMGSILGVVCIGSVHLVAGSIVGTAGGYMIEAVTAPAEEKKAAEAEVRVR